MRGLVIGGIAYVVAGFLTFGYVFNQFNCTSSSAPLCVADRGVSSVLSGAIWPIYWGGKGAIEVTR